MTKNTNQSITTESKFTQRLNVIGFFGSQPLRLGGKYIPVPQMLLVADDLTFQRMKDGDSVISSSLDVEQPNAIGNLDDDLIIRSSEIGSNSWVSPRIDRFASEILKEEYSDVSDKENCVFVYGAESMNISEIQDSNLDFSIWLKSYNILPRDPKKLELEIDLERNEFIDSLNQERLKQQKNPKIRQDALNLIKKELAELKLDEKNLANEVRFVIDSWPSEVSVPFLDIDYDDNELHLYVYDEEWLIKASLVFGIESQKCMYSIEVDPKNSILGEFNPMYENERDAFYKVLIENQG